ncbi:MAG: phosphoribosyltransferase family protein [Candidatus Omnitrophota bacterium]
MFEDREDAGRNLAKALEKYKDKGVIVLAIPRGGVEVGYEVARYLNADFSIIISRKLPFPDNPESGFGAVAEDGSLFLFAGFEALLSKEEVNRIISEQKSEIIRRITVLRAGKPLPNIREKIVILVDDGIAMGSTMRSAITLCKNKKAKRIVVAVPVSGEEAERDFAALVDEVIILEKPHFFQAVAQAYKNWHDVRDKEVISILEKWGSKKYE